MSNKETNPELNQTEQTGSEEVLQEQSAPETEAAADPAAEARAALAAKEDQLLRLAAEYDNFRRRSAKEKTEAYSKAKADAALAFLPVYDNLERALKQGTEDTAFLKGVEMTMTQLLNVLASLDIKPIEALGQSFDPNFHNAVMHVEDPSLGENVVAQVFQTGFTMGDKVIRFSMVQVAN
ncbi:MAG: nucleotide exchange factor GrpE [Oscillospiraceae bacterium]|nr:nucleotide exchange factor GrpE [Oscillospiraceae bacterium]